jgi:hypothetical protein
MNAGSERYIRPVSNANLTAVWVYKLLKGSHVLEDDSVAFIPVLRNKSTRQIDGVVVNICQISTPDRTLYISHLVICD